MAAGQKAQADGVLLIDKGQDYHKIVEILGFVRVDKKLVELSEDGADNSTRWVFDVHAAGPGAIEVQLLDPRGRPAATDIEPSFHLTPLSAAFYSADVYGDTEGTLLKICFSKACSFRVDADIIGANRR